MPDLSTLLPRVRAATGPSRDLDTDLANALCPRRNGARWHPSRAPALTASIDIALALAERQGWTLDSMGVDTDDLYWCQLRRGPEIVCEDFERRVPWTVAILAALVAGEIQRAKAETACHA